MLGRHVLLDYHGHAPIEVVEDDGTKCNWLAYRKCLSNIDELLDDFVGSNTEDKLAQPHEKRFHIFLNIRNSFVFAFING